MISCMNQVLKPYDYNIGPSAEVVRDQDFEFQVKELWDDIRYATTVHGIFAIKHHNYCILLDLIE